MKLSGITSIPIANQLRRSSQMVARSLERLASGKRINRASDDIAGYSLDVNLESQIRGLAQGTRNVNDALGMINTADAGIAAQLDLLQRMREIAVQASNGTLSSGDRTALNGELQHLMSEYNRISSETEFNGTKLLDGSFSTRSLQTGASSTHKYDVGLNNMMAASTFTKKAGTARFGTGTTNGVQSIGLATEDINNDGHLDLISAMSGATGPSTVLLGQGNGTFTIRSTINSLTTAGATLVDINNDGIKDFLAPAGGAITGVTVALGNGDGTFKAASTLSASPWHRYSYNLSVSDFNKDGNMDIAVAEGDFATLNIYFGNGDGKFQTPVTRSISGFNGTTTAGDFNGDGWADIAINNGNNVGVILNNGNGTFGATTNYAAGTTGYMVQNADFDGDGDLDLAMSNSGSSNVSVLLNNGDGTFASVTNYATGAGAGRIVLTDINNDGVVDIAARGSTSTYFLLGNGNGTFQTASNWSSSGNNNDFALGDFNEDGVLDLATADNVAGGLYTYMASTVTQAAISDVSVSTQSKAQAMIKIIDTALTKLKSERVNIGALQTRLTNTADSNGTLSANYAEAKSRNIDLDVANEVSELTRAQILQQAQVASLGQANVNMQVVLSLLGN